MKAAPSQEPLRNEHLEAGKIGQQIKMSALHAREHEFNPPEPMKTAMFIGRHL